MPAPCSNCGRLTNTDRLRTGRCMSCYRYWRKHGRERSEQERIRSPKERPPLCRRCKRRFATSGRLCPACNQYQRLNKRPRPRHLWADACTVCGRPRSISRRDGFVKGRCPACHSYYLRHGAERPPELIARYAPLGWCDCGHPAVELLVVPVHKHTETMPLCADCLILEKS